MFRWTLHLSGGPKTVGQAAVAVEHKVYTFGRLDYANMAQMCVNVFNTVSLRWRKLPPVTTTGGEGPCEVPSGCKYHTAVLIEDTIYIWGGIPFSNVLYAFYVDAQRWFKPRVSGTVPEGRIKHSACVLGKVMYIRGGWTQLTTCTNDMYKLDTTTMVWSFINIRGTPPPFLYHHFATIIGTKMFVLNYYNNIRVFDTETNCWLSTTYAQLPKGCRLHSAFAYNGELYIFGGEDWKTTLWHLWKFSPETFTWKKVVPKGKSPGKMCGMRCRTVGDRIILFGDETPHDLYMLDLTLGLKTLCKLAVIQYGLERSELTHDVRWELAAMTSTNSNYDFAGPDS